MAQALEKADPAKPMVLLSSQLMDLVEPWRETSWTRPSSVPMAVMTEVIEQREKLAVILAPAKRDNVRKWLTSLGVLVAGRMDVTEAKARLAAYCEMLEEPEFCFTRETLKAAAVEFKWWPSFAELHEFFRQQGKELRITAWRLKWIQDRCDIDEEIAAAREAEKARRLAEMLSTPGGRIRHKYWHKFFKGAPRRVYSPWHQLVEDLVAEFPEDMVDGWHAEVAALDWGGVPIGMDWELDIDPIAQLRQRAAAARETGGAA